MRVARFEDGAAGRILCVGSLQPVPRTPRGRILIVPPFAEEMNKSRHILAAIARQAGDLGYDALLPDLYGTGDSEGDFGDATIPIWRADLDCAIAAMPNPVPLHIVALRAGALLAVDALSRHEVQSLTLIHPQGEGRQVVTQMLRLRLAGGLLGGGERETAAQLRQRLNGGEGLECGGYRLTRDLAVGLEALSIDRLSADAARQVNWIELAPQADRPLMPVSQRTIEQWTSSGIAVHASVVVGDQFWATQEIAQCPALVEAVMQHFAG